jgi:hypothetical protein
MLRPPILVVLQLRWQGIEEVVCEEEDSCWIAKACGVLLGSTCWMRVILILDRV